MPVFELPRLIVETVVSATSSERLVAINRDPCPDERNVSIDTAIALELVDIGIDGIDRHATQIFVGGTLAFDGSLAQETQPGFDGPRAVTLHSADMLRIVLDPTTRFESQATIRVRVISQLVGGATSIDESYTFTIEDRTAPRLVAAQAIAPKRVNLAFDEEVIAPDADAIAFEALDAPAVPVRALATEVRGNVVEIELDTEMTPDVRYRTVAAGVMDAYRNVIEPPFDRTLFVGFRSARPKERRFDLWSMFPKHNRREDTTGDLFRFVGCLQEVLDLLLAEADRFPDLFDLERAPEPFLDAILADLGNPFRFDLDALGKRRLASVLVEMYRQKGTAIGIKNAIRFFLGIDVEAVALYTGSTLILGESELGVDWELGPSDRFALYAFDVIVRVLLTETERRQIRAIVDYMKPAHTHFVNLIEPSPPLALDHWELGLSLLGDETDLH